jgi:hypothetical protein
LDSLGGIGAFQGVTANPNKKISRPCLRLRLVVLTASRCLTGPKSFQLETTTHDFYFCKQFGGVVGPRGRAELGHSTRHRNFKRQSRGSRRASKDARPSTGYGDAAIQERRGRRGDPERRAFCPSSLDRFAYARDDGHDSTQSGTGSNPRRSQAAIHEIVISPARET